MNPTITYLDNAAQLQAAGGLFVAAVQLVAVLFAGWAAIAYIRSRRDP